MSERSHPSTWLSKEDLENDDITGPANVERRKIMGTQP